MLCNRNYYNKYSNNNNNDDSSIDNGEHLIRLDQYTGKDLSSCYNIGTNNDKAHIGILDRKIVRGGFLCDDPGLGKTITVLSLILQTMGLSTMSLLKEDNNVINNTSDKRSSLDHNSIICKDDHICSKKNDEEEMIFSAYWKEGIPSSFKRPQLNKLVNSLFRSCNNNMIQHFISPVDPKLDDCPDYFEIIQFPMCLSTIQQKIERTNEYNKNFNKFLDDIQLCFLNAKKYNPSDHEIHVAACQFLNKFNDLVRNYKKSQLRSARKSFSSTMSKPNCAVAALVEKETNSTFLKALMPSASTLLVIPSVLIDHWKEQIDMHVDLKYCTDKIPLIYEYNEQKYSDLDVVVFLCKVKKTHSPIFFIDKAGTKALPSPDFLAMFSVVITTTKRFTNEWKNGSFQEEVKRRKDNKYSSSTSYAFFDNRHDVGACPLLKVHWLRMIVDEGHSMGRGQGNSAIYFASWIIAQRRWVVTGTPTRQTLAQSGLNDLLCLMKFLQHDFFTPRLDGDKVWKTLITRSWKDGCLSSFFRLRSLLSLLMIRHTKSDIEELPVPRYHTTIVSMSPLEVTTYNTLVCAVQSNILITSMDAKTSGGQDSLLHRSQASHARKALSNIRLTCSGGTRIIPTLSDKFRIEFFEECEKLEIDQHKIHSLQQYLHCAETEELSRCQCCGIMLSTLLVLPCGDLICTECMDSTLTKCLVCNQPFDPDEFQLLQPGMNYQWRWNLEEEKAEIKARAMDDNPIEIRRLSVLENPSINNNNGILIQPPSGQLQRRKIGDGHKCVYDKLLATGKCVYCSTEHGSCNLINKLSRCAICYRPVEHCPKEESKATYIVDRILKLYVVQKSSTSPDCITNIRQHSCTLKNIEEMNIKARPIKVIVFSQFRKVLNIVGDRLLRRFGTACVAEYWGSYRSRELHKFSHDDECFCMLLGKDGSEGLDLSFVTHIFFLEAVWDKSLENQVVARAWRMGATGRVDVETLVAQNSVEEQMWKLEQAFAGRNDLSLSKEDIPQCDFAVEDGASSSEYVRTKVQYLLKNLQLIKHPGIIPLMNGDGLSKNSGKRKISQIISSPQFETHDIVQTQSTSCKIFTETKGSKEKRSKPLRVRFEF